MSGAACPTNSDSDSLFGIGDICFILSTPCRQHIVTVLDDERVITRRELYSRVVDLERQRRTDTERSNLRHSIRTNLAQKHLPKLDEHDVINDDGTSVTTGANFDVVADAMRTLEEVAE